MIHNCGVYMIENGINGHYYIGSSADLEGRFLTHLKDLQKGVHHNLHLQHAYDKYGEAQFFFRVILFCEPRERLRYEEALIKSWKPDYNIGWNGQGVWEKNDRLRKLIEEQETAIRPRKGRHGRPCKAVTPPRNRTIAEFDKRHREAQNHLSQGILR
jgi:group I intron endonuclease